MKIDFEDFNGFVEFVKDNGVYIIDRNISMNGIKILNETLSKSEIRKEAEKGKPDMLIDNAECYHVSSGGSGASIFRQRKTPRL